MKNNFILRVSIMLIVSLITLSASRSVSAGFFYGETVIGNPLAWEDNSSDTWVYFGGCEEQNKQACIADPDSSSHILVGDYDVKQGVYGLSVPGTDHNHGKVVLAYDYRFQTEENDMNTTDVAYIKLKDVDTNTNYHLKTLTAKDVTEAFQAVRIPLSLDVLQHKLQLVFEIVNDAERLSTLEVDNIIVGHTSEPVIRGTVYEKVAGKTLAIDGVNIKLQNRARTKTFYETTSKVQLDTPDSYTFWPVPTKKKLVVVATYNGEEKVVNIKKMKYSSSNADVNFTFED